MLRYPPVPNRGDDSNLMTNAGDATEMRPQTHPEENGLGKLSRRPCRAPPPRPAPTSRLAQTIVLRKPPPVGPDGRGPDHRALDCRRARPRGPGSPPGAGSAARRLQRQQLRALDRKLDLGQAGSRQPRSRPDAGRRQVAPQPRFSSRRTRRKGRDDRLLPGQRVGPQVGRASAGVSSRRPDGPSHSASSSRLTSAPCRSCRARHAAPRRAGRRGRRRDRQKAEVGARPVPAPS